MKDLSSKADDSMWATGQLGGATAGNDAMTAEGSEPAEPLEPTADAPGVTADDVDPRHLERAERAKAAARWVNVHEGR